MKLITRILLIFLVAISFTCSAQEYTIDDAGISFKIPQGFSIIDPKIKDPNIDERAYAELKRQKAILYLYNLEKRAEIYIVYAVTDQTKKASDYFHLSEKLDTKMYNFFKEELAKKFLGWASRNIKWTFGLFSKPLNKPTKSIVNPKPIWYYYNVINDKGQLNTTSE